MKSFWEYLTTPRKHACDITDCEPHNYFVERFNQCINKVDRMDLHKCDNKLEALEGLAQRFHFQELWISKLHTRLDELEKQIQKDKHE